MSFLRLGKFIRAAEGGESVCVKHEIFLEKMVKKREKRKDFILRGLNAGFGG